MRTTARRLSAGSAEGLGALATRLRSSCPRLPCAAEAGRRPRLLAALLSYRLSRANPHPPPLRPPRRYIKTYLLEKSRCTAITDPERTYHSFYQVFGAPDDVKGLLAKTTPDKCAVLGMSKAFKLTGIDDVGGDELSYKVR